MSVPHPKLTGMLTLLLSALIVGPVAALLCTRVVHPHRIGAMA